MTYFIAYDVTNSKRQHRVVKILKNYGIRVQYSFFQCELNKEMKEAMIDLLLSVVDSGEDKLSVYPVCNECLQKTERLGIGTISFQALYQTV